MSDAPPSAAAPEKVMAPTGGRKKSAWMRHVSATMKSEKGKKGTMGKGWFKHVLKTAKATYKKKGGGSALSPSPVGGTRRRRRRGGK
jgi:hypothetical protein